jgi:hypothetical protein
MAKKHIEIWRESLKVKDFQKLFKQNGCAACPVADKCFSDKGDRTCAQIIEYWSEQSV